LVSDDRRLGWIGVRLALIGGRVLDLVEVKLWAAAKLLLKKLAGQ
jgi:hypothetical protein